MRRWAFRVEVAIASFAVVAGAESLIWTIVGWIDRVF